MLSVICVSKLCWLHSEILLSLACVIINAITRNEAENNECQRCLQYKRGRKCRRPIEFLCGSLKVSYVTDYRDCREENAK